MSIIEVLAAGLVLGIAVVGIATMFGRGSAFVAGSGDERAATALAQQRIEQIRANGWNSLGTEQEPVGRPILDQNIVSGNNQVFTRTVCIQYIQDATTTAGLADPTYDPSCPPGAVAPTATVRITVTVTSNQPEPSPVTLQAWMTDAGR